VIVDNNVCDKRIVFKIVNLCVKLACNMVKRQKACVVASEFIIFTRIAETDYKKFNRSRGNSFASFKEHLVPQEIAVLKL